MEVYEFCRVRLQTRVQNTQLNKTMLLSNVKTETCSSRSEGNHAEQNNVADFRLDWKSAGYRQNLSPTRTSRRKFRNGQKKYKITGRERLITSKNTEPIITKYKHGLKLYRTKACDKIVVGLTLLSLYGNSTNKLLIHCVFKCLSS